jgi:DNA-directed RNA polymerase specialized sigma24 family protein
MANTTPHDPRASPSTGATGPAPHSGHEVTELLRAWGAGDVQASESLVPLVYAELRRQAQLALRREDDGHTLQPTALVHEAWLRLGNQRGARWESRTQFFAIAARIMRRVLLDYARTHRALKRGGGAVQVSLADAIMDPQKARLVDLRYFAGLSIPEVAAALGVSTATVGREWAVARMWLRRELER